MMLYCNSSTCLCHDLAKWLSHYLFFFFLLDLQLQDRARESITWLCHNITIMWWMVTDGHVTVCHMTRVIWGPWESKCIATVIKCISSRELSENSIEFSLSNSEQRDSWLNSSHRTLDANKEFVRKELFIEVGKPKDCCVVSYKWIFKCKLGPDSQVERYKACLVA